MYLIVHVLDIIPPPPPPPPNMALEIIPPAGKEPLGSGSLRQAGRETEEGGDRLGGKGRCNHGNYWHYRVVIECIFDLIGAVPKHAQNALIGYLVLSIPAFLHV